MSTRMQARPGFTLVELLVVSVLLVVTVSALFGTLGVQQRSSQAQSAIISAQQTTRTGLAVLANELREVSAEEGDLLQTTATSISFRAFRAAAFICEENKVDAWAEVWVAGDTLAVGDRIAIFVDGVITTADDDGWRLSTVVNVKSTSACDDWASKKRQRLIVTSADLTGVEPGAPIRSFDVVSYGLADVDGRWVLARQRNDGNLVELVGPIAAEGVSFRYFTADGTEITPAPSTAAARQQVALIELSLRADHRGASGRDAYSDSLVTRVALRGNTRQ